MAGYPAVVMDCGTGYTKLGFAGNVEPSCVLPTAVALSDSITRGPSGRVTGLEDLDYFIGEAALQNASTHLLRYPVRHGVVDNWDDMERFWLQCIYKKLRVSPEDHNFILTEPPLNTPENRELSAEIMFETFNVAGLYIGVQAVLALGAAYASQDHQGRRLARGLTGTVIDSGDGMTHVIPVSDGYVIGSAIKSIPVAGRDITNYVQQLLRERGEPVPPDMSFEVAREIKERHCYLCSDIAREFGRHDADPQKFVKLHSGFHAPTATPFSCDVGYERFLGPEVYFTPEIYSSDWTTPLPQVVDNAIQACPIDTRRELYSNVVLSGGSTMFRDFSRRVQRDMKRIVDARTPPSATPIEVNVRTQSMQKYAVWLGGSILGMKPEFQSVCHSRADYEEHGAAICRANAVFKEL